MTRLRGDEDIFDCSSIVSLEVYKQVLGAAHGEDLRGHSLLLLHLLHLLGLGSLHTRGDLVISCGSLSGEQSGEGSCSGAVTLT